MDLIKKRVIPGILTLNLVLSLMPLSAFASEPKGGMDYNRIISETEYRVAPGIAETDILINNQTGTEQNLGYVLEVDLKNPNVTIKAGYKDYQGTNWGMQSTTDQAAAAENKLKQQNPDTKVVGAVNANFFNMATGEPSGALVMNGKECHPTNTANDYFAVLNDGTAEIRYGSEPIDENVVEAMGGNVIILKDGDIVTSRAPETHAQSERNPRTAIGLRADGTVVLFVNDGRQAPTSYGMTLNELAEMMKQLGCVDALT
ncbi:MAG: phosphodiester glycosidase family protein, partial [Lentisphaerae bacterium]|nr:phosphodiester glycosidase family protein [Lentisphaerota bacterium]